VIVIGCGGVGSWAATMLVRSGVGKVRLVDFDQVTLSSLNRHAVATLADVGTPKVMTLRKHLEQVAPWVEINARNELWNIENGEELLSGNPTYVVDAIDNIDTKVDLLHFCKARGIPVISSMGAGCKSDPTRVYYSSSLPTATCLLTNLRSILGTFQNLMRILSLAQPGDDYGKRASQLGLQSFIHLRSLDLAKQPYFRSQTKNLRKERLTSSVFSLASVHVSSLYLEPCLASLVSASPITS